jgi:hypothetical protein
MSSTRKKSESMTRRILIRAERDKAIAKMKSRGKVSRDDETYSPFSIPAQPP